MGVTKKDDFSKQTLEMSSVLKALGHPARLEIINVIALNPNATCTNIVERISLSQSTISKHLHELKNANIIVGTHIGSITHYVLNDECIVNSCTFLDEINKKNKKKPVQKPIQKPVQKQIKSDEVTTYQIPIRLEPEIPVYKPKPKNKKIKSNVDLKKFNYVFKKAKNKK
jgi:ArsR family transcriptional regulator, arsenate/arsenite/antimonite-responsive transcriptional repressor